MQCGLVQIVLCDHANIHIWLRLTNTLQSFFLWYVETPNMLLHYYLLKQIGTDTEKRINSNRQLDTGARCNYKTQFDPDGHQFMFIGRMRNVALPWSTYNVYAQCIHERLIWSVPFDRSDQRIHTYQYIRINIYCIIYAEYVRLKRFYFPKASSVNKQNNDYLHRNVDTRTDTEYKSFLIGRWVWPRKAILVTKVVK